MSVVICRTVMVTHAHVPRIWSRGSGTRTPQYLIDNFTYQDSICTILSLCIGSVLEIGKAVCVLT